MKKIFIGLIAIAFSAIPSFAQNNIETGKTICPENTVYASAQNCSDSGICANCPGREKCLDCKACKGCLDGKVCGPCVKTFKGGVIGWGLRNCPGLRAFEGLNLSESQKSQLQQICKNWQSNTDNVVKECNAPVSLSTIQCNKNHDGYRTKCIENQKKCLTEVKKILTPEQYTQFLEKCFIDSHGNQISNKGKYGHRSFGDRRKGNRRCQR